MRTTERRIRCFEAVGLAAFFAAVQVRAGVADAGGIADCNRNGIADAAELSQGTVEDCNANEVPDECEICSTTAARTGEPRECCAPHAGASCDCPACAAAVCGADPFCCEDTWDEICARSAVVSAECPCGASRYEPRTDCDADGVPDDCQTLSPWRGSALDFDGLGAYATMGVGEALRMGAEFTLEAWIRPAGRGSDPINGGVIANREGEFELARFADGTIRFALANGVPGWLWVTTDFDAPLLAWTHVALVYDAPRRAVRLVADGREVFALVGSVGGAIQDVEPQLNEFRIGGRQRVAQFFDGRIDEVRLWNYARQAQDIAADRLRWLDGDEPGLAGYWRCNEGRGGAALDRAADHHATLAGARWIESPRCLTPGDVDGDGAVGAGDVREWARCSTGPALGSRALPCRPDERDAADFQRDRDVDLFDLHLLLNRLAATKE